jgi:hypothetical protein
MPKAEITSANSGEGGKAGPYKEPHEREIGWDEWELEHAGHQMEEADKIKANPKYVEAIAKHHEKKAKKHRKLAASMKGHMARGLVSEKALEKASK